MSSHYSVISFIINKQPTQTFNIENFRTVTMYFQEYLQKNFHTQESIRIGFFTNGNELTIIIENLKMVYNDVNVIMNGNIYLDNKK